MTSGKSGKVAASLVTGVKRKKQKKGKAKGAEGSVSKELFSGDGLPSKPAAGGSSKVYAGGARSQKVKAPRKAGGLSKPELNQRAAPCAGWSSTVANGCSEQPQEALPSQGMPSFARH
ncbi:DEAD-box ATP-dependent RNA helicase 28 [Chlorella sorokiniana]|uniref:DEAD-box ATP-dependent RNA helicase 28 n=1 Tax=Chlorella sorokiniana TaxID=3076 RepID=A0A2P6TM98_CHLSO|nr:DEAD-box ATP-dependent RNA helicase 28 [Chlorella sorokiniana]|eukprot:PRW45425.1 DEAD-box ATP-dependent RNA helicase 28 [Chlorella sorokiniana]